MFFYILKILSIIILLSIIVILTLKTTLNIQEDKLVQTTIILVGTITIIYIIFDKVSNKEGFEVTENAENVEQQKEIEENVAKDVQKILNTVMDENNTNEIIEDGPKPSTNSSLVNNEISETKNEIQDNLNIEKNQKNVEYTSAPIQLYNEDNTIKTEIDVVKQDELTKQVEDKYNILPVEQWLKPEAKDIIKATPCMCPTVSDYNDMYAMI